jgi:hypothetical protein
MKFLISWVLSLFSKPKEEIDPKATAWPFPVVSEDFEPRPKKPAAKKAPAKKVAAKKVSAKNPLEAHFSPTKKKTVKKVTKRLKALEK